MLSHSQGSELPLELLMLWAAQFGIWVEIGFSEFALFYPTSFLASLPSAFKVTPQNTRRPQTLNPKSRLGVCLGALLRAQGVDLGPAKTCAGSRRRGSQMRSPRTKEPSSMVSEFASEWREGGSKPGTNAQTRLQKVYQRYGILLFRKGAPSSLNKSCDKVMTPFSGSCS